MNFSGKAWGVVARQYKPAGFCGFLLGETLWGTRICDLYLELRRPLWLLRRFLALRCHLLIQH